MSILKLIQTVLRLLTGYFELKNKSISFDLVRDSENRQDDLIQQIEYLREKATEESTSKADFLRGRLQREKKYYEDILVSNAADDGSDTGGL
jgi:hypothetical protein|tara:strand:+ start:77510 stop:77785 length:276 start_codon:yes stop_codon:yes gene_type:complete